MYLTFLAQKIENSPLFFKLFKSFMICIFILKSDMYDSLLKMGTLSVHLKNYFKNEYKIT